jgi:hypothetical protein
MGANSDTSQPQVLMMILNARASVGEWARVSHPVSSRVMQTCWIAQGSRQALGRASGGRAAPPMAPMVFSYVIAVLKRVLGAAAPGLGRVAER